jgi:3D (Asp-Asp-Asp) domain-containing protein
MTTFVVTAYCGGKCCNGEWAGKTASQKIPCEGRTCAASKNYAFGTIIQLDGIGTFVVEDRGKAITGNRIDIYMTNHNDANNFGRKVVTGRVVK